MSAASPKAPEKAQEPSMEEILASIRRIIADDQNAKAEVVPPVRAAPMPMPENDDVLDLADVAQPVRKPNAVPIDEPEIGFADSADIDFDSISFDDEPEPEPVRKPDPKPAPAARQPEPPRPAYRPAPEPPPSERLVSAVTDASVGQAFGLLSSSMMTGHARTLEDLVQDMLRPMLKSWLDDNLPSMVERLVRAEIERVARGR